MNGIDNLQPTVDEFAPLFHVRKDAPPLVLITGDRELELFGRYEENAYMWRMMKLSGTKKHIFMKSWSWSWPHGRSGILYLEAACKEDIRRAEK